MLYVLVLTAGESMVTGLFIGIKKGSRPDLVFGLSGLVLVILFLISNHYFTFDNAHYTPAILVKRSFIFACCAAMAWFTKSYTGLDKKALPVPISTMIGITCLIMVAVHPTFASQHTPSTV